MAFSLNRPSWIRTGAVIAASIVLVTLAATLAPSVTAQPAAPSGLPIAGVIAIDGANSRHAGRLVDGVQPPGTGDDRAWLNPDPWLLGAYPMTTVLDLGRPHQVASLSYFVGNINQGTDRVVFERSTSTAGDDWQPLTTVSDGHRWRQWRTVELGGQEARRIRVRFDDRWHRFNISEIVVRATGQPNTTTSTQPTTTTSTQPTTTSTEPSPTTVTGPTTTGPTTTTPTTTTTTGPTTITTTTTTTGPIEPPGADQPRATPPPAGVVSSHGFGNWPNGHLTPACIDLHDRYWTTGPGTDPGLGVDHPENRAYHTWHPAVTTHPDTGERCDFGHEHGFDPSLAPSDVFELFGRWPAFGYVAETSGGHRHEDHVGHKVTVANFRASIGNAAGPDRLYDAGFECDWLSKIHQGSYSLDAFSNHLHEYFLAVRCYDGLNPQGQVDNTVVGTRFSVKVLYTYGRPNRFVEDNCAGAEISFPSSILTGPEGRPVPNAHQTTPIGNDSHNDRGFTCISGVEWKDLGQIQNVDLWTQLIKIQRNDGHTALTIQPYYIVKNPARIIAAYDGRAGEQPSRVIRTITACYDDSGQRLNRPFCAGAPAQQPDWRSPDSPFNGTFRAVNFKASHVANVGGPARFCTDPFGFPVDDPLPCERGNVSQTVTPFDNHWNDGRYRYQGRQGNIQGSIWAEDPFGNRFEARPNPGGGYDSNGVGFEFIVDNRNPDDDRDGVPDGARIRGEN